MPLPSDAFHVPELQELWATAQETKAVFLTDVKATAEAIGTSLEELIDWLNEEGIMVLADENDDATEVETNLIQGVFEGEEEEWETVKSGAEEIDTALVNPLQVLFKSLRWTRLLTPEEEVALFQKMHQGDTEAREQIIESNLRLVLSIASQFAQKSVVPLEDLVQEGCLGLIRAVDKFDWRRGNRFSTYAVWWIRQYIVRAIAEHSRFIHLPFHLVETLAQFVATTQRLTQELGRQPSNQEIADALGISVERVDELTVLLTPPLSLDMPVDEEEELVLEDIVPDLNAVSPEDAYFRNYAREQIKAILAETLTDREWEVIKLRYGLLDGRTYTLEEIGRMLKISGEAVRHIEQRALSKLRRPRYRKLLERLSELLA
ncbi:MAG: sigma-70 family RNA polymerase sigma factor [Armatimonadota bacterium]|nr:sigma-70 family RNA polymerase sigma factor [Armatimonadota bacterium]MDW8142526.1 sigma-70 family RNA polymerase sigma factor [Armatimonadota bacterium]